MSHDSQIRQLMIFYYASSRIFDRGHASHTVRLRYCRLPFPVLSQIQTLPTGHEGDLTYTIDHVALEVLNVPSSTAQNLPGEPPM